MICEMPAYVFFCIHPKVPDKGYLNDNAHLMKVDYYKSASKLPYSHLIEKK